MSLNADDRAALFRTDNIQNQIQKYLLKKPGYTTTITELREFFFDASKGSFQYALIALATKGVISNEDGKVTLEASRVRFNGEIADKVWRAALIEKRFTVSLLVYMTGLEREQIYTALAVLIKKGHVEKVGVAPGDVRKVKVYQVVTDSVVRPKSDMAHSRIPLMEFCMIGRRS